MRIIHQGMSVTIRVASIIAFTLLLAAWVTPVDMNADHGDDVVAGAPCAGGDDPADVALNCHTITLNDNTKLDRCDTPIGAYESRLPSTCHRRNLIWKLGSKPELTQWNPQLGNDKDWRLPTIKELSRLMDYSNAETLDPNTLLISFFEEANTFEIDKSWLISSTYRDIDGEAKPASDNNGSAGNAQIFGIHTKTGEVAAFDTEKELDATELETGVTFLKKCTSLSALGVCSNEDAKVFTLLVRTQTVKQLL